MGAHADPRVGDALRALLRELAADDLPDVLELARADARERVRAVLADQLAEEMLSRAVAGSEPEPPDEAGEALYVLCVVGADAAIPDGVVGIGGAPTHTIKQGPLAAIVCPVTLREFGEQSLREHLGDLGWLEQTARSHEMALELIGTRTTLVPLRLCTVFRAESGVRELLHREADRLTGALAQLDGRREWGLKVFAGAVPEEDAGGPASDGTDYLRRRQAARDRRSDRAGAITAACREIHERLAAQADDARSNPPQRPEASGEADPMVLNGAYLVPDAELDRFLDHVDALQERHGGLGLELQLTGPWPAYNFVPDAIGVA